MLDISHIPNTQKDTQIFYAGGTTYWQTWVKPRGAKFICILALSGGGGGAGGSSGGAGTSGTANTGGGAGGVSISYLTFASGAQYWANVGAGGVQVSGATGGTGGISFQADTATGSALVLNNNNTITGGTGGVGTVDVAGTAGVGFNGHEIAGSVSGSAGSVTLSLPQSIATSSTPTFAGVTVGSVTLTDALLGTATQALTDGTATVVDSFAVANYSGAKEKEDKPEITIIKELITEVSKDKTEPIKVDVENGRVTVSKGKDIITNKSKEDFKIEVVNGTLTIRGTHKAETETNEKNFFRGQPARIFSPLFLKGKKSNLSKC